MALEHQNISIGEATAADAAAVAQSAWRDALLDHASGKWTLDEEFDSSGGTVHWVVVKNTDGADLDFWVCIGRVVATGVMGCFVGEDYVAASNILSKFAPRSDNTGYILADGYYSANGTDIKTFTLGTALPSANGEPLCAAITAASTERLFTSVEADYAVLNVNDQTQYIGALVDLIVPKTGLVATPAIGCADLMNASQGRFASITQHPVAAADAPVDVSTPHSAIIPWGGAYQDMCLIHNLGFLSAAYGFADRYQNDRVVASEIAFIMQSSMDIGYSKAKARADKVGALRAKFKGLRITSGPFAAATYDDIVVDGNKHVVIGTQSWSGGSPYWQPLFPNGYNTFVKAMFVMDTGIAA